MGSNQEEDELRGLPAPTENLSALFHMVNRLIPADQVVHSISPDVTAGEALSLMKEHCYSQLPVVQGRSILGLFTYQSFALEVAQMYGSSEDPCDLPVQEFLGDEPPKYARLTDEFQGMIDLLDADGVVVVSGPEDLVALLTPMDVVVYLYSATSAFVLLEEIELSLRTLIGLATSQAGVLQECIRNALSHDDRSRDMPETFEDMTFQEYIQLVGHKRNWGYLGATFSGTRARARSKLEPVRKIRNDVFHFRREISAEDHERLARCRAWLLRCTRRAEAIRRDGP